MHDLLLRILATVLGVLLAMFLHAFFSKLVKIWRNSNGVGPYRYDYVCSTPLCQLRASCTNIKDRDLIRRIHEETHPVEKSE